MTRAPPVYDRESLARDLDVPRETLARLDLYEALLRRWQDAVNLVGRDTLADVWRRHFLDSGQLLRHLPESYDALYDIGSGAGFPGLVLAILGAHDVTLIESDQRKCAFLREAARLTDTGVCIVPERAERLRPPAGSWPARRVLVARAVAPLGLLLDTARGLIDSTTCCVMLKGANAASEIAEAQTRWHMRLDTRPSLSETRGVVLMISDLSRVSGT